MIEDLSSINKNGDAFRYLILYSLEYRFDNKKLDISNVYRVVKSLIVFLDGCDIMFDEIADYENEIKAEHEAELRAEYMLNIEWY